MFSEKLTRFGACFTQCLQKFCTRWYMHHCLPSGYSSSQNYDHIGHL